MQEYVSEAVVLEYEPMGDLDGRFSLYTKTYGRLRARATSTRKITSKLVGHLQPGMVSDVRIVEKNGLRVVDALKVAFLERIFPKLTSLNALLHDAEPEPDVWALLRRGDFAWRDMLRVLGWDPAHAACAACGTKAPTVFHISTQEFFCTRCVPDASKARPDALLYVS